MYLTDFDLHQNNLLQNDHEPPTYMLASIKIKHVLGPQNQGHDF